MQAAAAIERIRRKYVVLSPAMDERLRRQWAAAEALAIGWGGVSAVSVATGLARNTIALGGGANCNGDSGIPRRLSRLACVVPVLVASD